MAGLAPLHTSDYFAEIDSSTRHRPMHTDFSVETPDAGSQDRAVPHSKVRVRYIGNQRIIGSNKAFERGLRVKLQADAAARHPQPWLVPEEPPLPKMPLPAKPRNPKEHHMGPVLSKAEDEQRRKKLLGLPLAYSDPLFIPRDPEGVDPHACFSPATLAQTMPPVRLPALDSSGRIALVSSLYSMLDEEPEETINPQTGSPLLNNGGSQGTGLGFMEKLRSKRESVRQQRHEQQRQQSLQMYRQLLRMEQEARERETHRVRVRTMESAQLWLTFKQAQEGSEDAVQELRLRSRVLRDCTPSPHTLLLDPEEGSVAPSPSSCLSSGKRRAVDARAHYHSQSPSHKSKQTRRNSPVLPHQFAEPPVFEIQVDEPEDSVPLEQFVRMFVCDLWDSVGLGRPSDSDAMFAQPYEGRNALGFSDTPSAAPSSSNFA